MMAETGSELKVDAVLDELFVLRKRIDQLERRLESLEGGAVAPTDISPAGVLPPVAGGGEGVGEWLSRGAVLQRLAAACFILVFALLLRTITDNGYVGRGGGTFLGLAYVTALVLAGFVFYRQRRPLAPVLAGCGFLLLFSIVLEGSSRFAVLSVAQVFVILVVALAAGSFMGLRFAAPRLLAVSTMGVAFSGLVIGFPRLVFPAAGVLVLAVSLVAEAADRRGLASGLKWWAILLSLSFWALWGFKLFATFRQGQPLEPFYAAWYLPLLFVFGGFYLMVAAGRFLRSAEIGLYAAVLPSLNVLLLFLAGRVIVSDVWGTAGLFGALAVGFAGAHILAGWNLSSRDDGRCGATGGSMVAGALMLALGLPQLLGGLAWVLPGWALTAYGLARLSGRCNSAVIRVISYLYQFFGLLVGVLGGVMVLPKEGGLVAPLVSALALALFGLAHYHWCRQHRPPAGSTFARLDEGDHSAVVLLLCGLGGFYALGALMLDAIAAAALADPANMGLCGRSVLINLGVLLLLLLGSRWRRTEFLWVALAVAVVGCFKVFVIDLFRGSGLPLVLSVLSFGVVAAFGSVIMGRRQGQVSGSPVDD